jgi:hypothetical protein
MLPMAIISGQGDLIKGDAPYLSNLLIDFTIRNPQLCIPSVKGGEAQKVFAAWLFDLGPAE